MIRHRPAAFFPLFLPLIALLTLLLPAAPALAWNPTGHMLSAYIAWQQLTPPARQQISALLAQHPQYQDELLRGLPEDFADKDLYAFLLAATWPDRVRSSSNPLNEAEHHGNWHYIERAFCRDEVAAPQEPQMQWQTGKAAGNVVQALSKNSSELGDAKLPAERRAIALSWVEHLVGDIHMPLHNCTVFSREYPRGDQGGNLTLVRTGLKVLNLHAFWDNAPGDVHHPAAVAFLARRLLAPAQNHRQALPQLAENPEFSQWSDESFSLGRDIVHDGGHLRGLSDFISRVEPSATVPALPLGYEALARDLAGERVLLAGYRLADVLNRIFATPAQTP